MEIRNITDWYDGQDRVVPLDFTRRSVVPAVKTTTPNQALLKRASRIEGEEGLWKMDERVLVRSGIVLAHATPAKKDEYGEHADRVVQFCVVSGESARDNKGLNVRGIDKAPWIANPVIPWCHMYNEVPVARGRYIATVERGSTHELWSHAEFMPKDLNPFGYYVGRMYAGGWLRGNSLGWIPTKLREVRSKSGGRLLRVISEESEMIEYSACPIPVDRWALAEAASAGVFGKGTERSANLEMIARMMERSADWRGFSEGVAYDVSGRDVKTMPDVSKGSDDLDDDCRRALDEARDALTRAVEPSADRKVIEEHTIDPDSNLGNLEDVAWSARSEGEEGEDEPEDAGVDGEGRAAGGDGGTGDGASGEGEGEGAGEGEGDPSRSAGDGLPGEILRGEVSDELDLAYDRIRGAVINQMDAADRLWSLTHTAYWQGRSIREELGLEARAIDVNPDSPEALEQMVMRQTKRLRNAASMVTDSSLAADDAVTGTSTDLEQASLEDAMSLVVERMADEGVELRAGKKIAGGRREKLGDLLKAVQNVAKGLKAVLAAPEGGGKKANADASKDEDKTEETKKAEAASMERINRYLDTAEGGASAKVKEEGGGDDGTRSADGDKPGAAAARMRAIVSGAPKKDSTAPSKRANVEGTPGVRVPEKSGRGVSDEFVSDLIATMRASAKAQTGDGTGAT